MQDLVNKIDWFLSRSMLTVQDILKGYYRHPDEVELNCTMSGVTAISQVHHIQGTPQAMIININNSRIKRYGDED